MLDTPTQGQAAIHRDRLRVMRQEQTTGERSFVMMLIDQNTK